MAPINTKDPRTLTEATRVLALSRPLGMTLNPARARELRRLLKAVEDKRRRKEAA